MSMADTIAISAGAVCRETSTSAPRRPTRRRRTPSAGEAGGFARLGLACPLQAGFGFHRPRDEIALRKIAAELAQQVPVRLRFNALRDGGDAEFPRHLQAGLEDHPRRILPGGIGDERTVDLDFGEGDAGELLHRRVA